MSEDNDFDADMMYKLERDNNTEELIEKTDKLVDELSELFYYKGSPNRILKDMIWRIADRFNLKLEVNEIHGMQFVEVLDDN